MSGFYCVLAVKYNRPYMIQLSSFKEKIKWLKLKNLVGHMVDRL